jgi:hypothetical protein
VWLVGKVFVVGVALIAQLSLPHHGAVARNGAWYFQLLFRWDSGYLKSIAQTGYFSPHSNPKWIAFFPGYPGLSRGVAETIDPGVWVSGHAPGPAAIVFAMWLVSMVASLAAAILLFRLVDGRLGQPGAFAATALLVFGPYAFVLSASYSESLFLALAIAAWSFGCQNRWFAAGWLAAAASLVRPNGLFLASALVVMYLVRERPEGKRRIDRDLVGVGLGFAGIGGYFLYLLAQTGSIAAWTGAQAVWGRSLQWPWTSLYETAGRAVLASSLDRRIQFSLDLLFALGLVLAILWFWHRRRWPELAFAGLTAAALMTSFSYMSLARNTVTVFPIVIALAASRQRPRTRWLYWIALAAGAALLIFNTYQFALGRWAD